MLSQFPDTIEILVDSLEEKMAAKGQGLQLAKQATSGREPENYVSQDIVLAGPGAKESLVKPPIQPRVGMAAYSQVDSAGSKVKRSAVATKATINMPMNSPDKKMLPTHSLSSKFNLARCNMKENDPHPSQSMVSSMSG